MKNVVIMALTLAMSTLSLAMPEDGVAQERARAGFYLRADLGGGYGSASTDVEGANFDITGLTGLTSLDLGAFLNPNLVLFGEFFASSMLDPTFEMSGMELETEDVTLSTSGVGAGLAYYLSDRWFLQGTVLASQMTVEVDGQAVGETDIGFGFKGAVGAAWPVSNKVALGATTQFFFASMKDKGDNAPTWTSLGGGLEFTFIWIPKGNMKGTAL